MFVRSIKGPESRKHVPCDEVYRSKHGGVTYGLWQRFAWGENSMKANMTLIRPDCDPNIGPGTYTKSTNTFLGSNSSDKNKNVFLKGVRKTKYNKTPGP
jgi:hypothetical protein